MPVLEADRGDKFKLHSVEELLKLREPEWLIQGLFPIGSLVGLYGASGHGKSFVALDWALSIAVEIDWFGRALLNGPVVYVAAEGGRSIRKRVQAWRQHHRFDWLPDAFFLLEGVQVIDDRELKQLHRQIDALDVQPQLIVLDTLARCFVGSDENSAQEMGKFIEGLEWLKRQTGATVMVLHHTGKPGTDSPKLERGSSALRAALDVMIRVEKKTEGLIVIRNDKQKDDEEFRDIHLHLKRVQVGDESEDSVTSCVLVSSSAMGASQELLPSHLHKTLRALASFPEGTARFSDWRTKAKCEDRTLHSHRKALIVAGYVERPERGVYRITAKGKTALGTAATALRANAA